LPIKGRRKGLLEIKTKQKLFDTQRVCNEIHIMNLEHLLVPMYQEALKSMHTCAPIYKQACNFIKIC
jgi:hypothetical protein